MVTAWKYTQDPSAENVVMFIDKHIGFDEEDGPGIVGSDFKRELLELDSMGKKSIRVEINSPGGVVTEAMEIYHAILSTDTKVDTYCYGIAASSAGLIFQAGRNRIMADNSILMYHNPFDSTDPKNKKPDPARDAIQEACVTMVSSRSGLSKEEVQKMMDETTFLKPEAALKLKMCDSIEDSGDKNKKRASSTDVKAIWKESQVYFSKYKNSITQPDMKKICAKLLLNPEASEESIMLEIDRIQAKHKDDMDDLDKKMKAMKSDMDKHKADYEGKCNEYKALEEKFNALKKKDDDEEMDKKKDKAKKVVDSAVKLGKIVNKADIIKDWEDKFVADETGITKLLEGMGVSMKAPDITKIVDKTGDIVDTTNLSEEEKEVVAWEAKTGLKYGSAAWINYKNNQAVNKVVATQKF